VCALYNDELHFHNFHHAFTVFAVSAEVVRAVGPTEYSPPRHRLDTQYEAKLDPRFLNGIFVP